eukprot:scaffold59212_cov13-Tisochrysis_lutea.AAC.1
MASLPVTSTPANSKAPPGPEFAPVPASPPNSAGQDAPSPLPDDTVLLDALTFLDETKAAGRPSPQAERRPSRARSPSSTPAAAAVGCMCEALNYQ